MALAFILGRAGYGKTSYIFEQSLSEKRKKYILVPDQVNFEYEKMLIKKIPDTIRQNIEVVTFTSLARRIFYETGGASTEPLNNAGKALIIYRLISSLKDELTVFGKNNLSRGLVNLIAAQIREMKNSLITVADLMILSEKMKESAYLCNKIKDLAAIYQKYEEYIKEKYYDGEDELSNIVRKIPGSVLFSDSVIYFDSFNSFSQLELKVIDALMMNGNDIFFAITADPYEMDSGFPVWNTVIKTIKKIKETARSRGIPVNKDIILSKRCKKRSAAIDHIEKELFKSPSSIYSGQPGGLTLAKCQNLYSETESAAKEIRKLTRTGNMRYRNISVIVPDLSNYGIVISEVFGMYGIPFHMDEKLRFSDHSLARYIIDLFDAFSTGYQYESMVNVLKSEYTDLRPDEMDILENHVLAKGIKGLKWYDENFFTGGEIQRIWNKFISPVRELYLELKKDMTGKSVSAGIYRFITGSGLPKRLAGIESGYIKENGRILASRLSQSYSIMMDVLEDISEIYADVRLSLNDIYEIFICSFSEYSLATIPFGMDEILVGDIKRSGKEDIRAMFILGANDGAFASERSESTIFTDSELSKIIGSGFDKVPDPDDTAPDNEYLLYTTLAKPSWILAISCPMSDMTGRMAAVSNIYDRLVMLFYDLAVYQEPAVTLRKQFRSDSEYTVKSILKDISVEMRKKKAGIGIDDIYISLYGYLKDSNERKTFDIISKGLNYSNYSDKVEESSIKEIFGRSFHSSISRLQKFRQCPFSFFMEYGLNIKERKVKEFSKADAGTFVHEVLEKFQIEAFRGKDTANEANIGEILNRAIDSVLIGSDSWMLNEEGIFSGIKKDLIDKLETTCRIIYENTVNSRFKPFLFEAEFCEKGEFPPIILQTESGDRITVDGKIDRIDVFSEGEDVFFAVFDYKTGNKVFSLSDIYHGLDLQLLVYLDALIKGDAKAKTAGAFYFHVKDPIIKGEPEMQQDEIDREIKKQYKLSGIAINDPLILDSLDRFEKNRGYYQTLPVQIKDGVFSKTSKVASSGQFFDLFRFVEKKLIELSEGVRSGIYPIKPIKYVNTTACKYCNYLKICQFDISVKQNRYDVLHNINDEEFWKIAGAEDNGQ